MDHKQSHGPCPHVSSVVLGGFSFPTLHPSCLVSAPQGLVGSLVPRDFLHYKLYLELLILTQFSTTPSLPFLYLSRERRFVFVFVFDSVHDTQITWFPLPLLLFCLPVLLSGV